MSALPIREVEKPWGRDTLPAPFVAPPGKRIGEIWFEPPPELPSLLVKYIFTSEKLSIQVHPDDAAFAAIESESVDYAVMENTVRAAMVPADMAWSDIGNWDALHDALARDEAGNAVQGPAELVDCANVLVSSDGPRVSVIGAHDLIVVVDGGEVLVTTAAAAQKVGKLSGALDQ